MQGAGKKIRALFLCTGNSCRSQMAEAWARVLLAEVVEPYSAGTAPRLDPLAIIAMAEAGVDIPLSAQSPSTISRGSLDLVVAVCSTADENCPVFPGAKRGSTHPSTTRRALLKAQSPAKRLLPSTGGSATK